MSVQELLLTGGRAVLGVTVLLLVLEILLLSVVNNSTK